ncbi:MAG: hypothetical protein KF799_05645 [Bdellovibrionales bacterium]|nr:hypothetical protein [Bdellovibrionales bacterium]
MMMDCPRCGFSQPKDRFCASCGMDVDAFLLKPKPLWVRILQNPNLHLSLIAIFMVLLVGYILYTQSTLVSRGVRQMLGTPLTSKEAADPADAGATPLEESADEIETVAAEIPEPVALTAQPGSTAPAAAAVAAAKEPTQIEAVFWEVAHDTLSGLFTVAEKVGESNAGRVFLFKDGGKIADAIRAGSRRVSQPRLANLATGAQLTIETPPTAPEPFQFGMALQVAKWENREATLRWFAQMVLSQPETPAEMASQVPAVKAVVESTLNGSTALGAAGLLVIVLEPNNRMPREEYLNKAGEGPWRIFASEDFRNGVTEWVVLVDLK